MAEEAPQDHAHHTTPHHTTRRDTKTTASALLLLLLAAQLSSLMAMTASARRPSGPVLSVSHYRSASPTRVKLAGGGALSPGASVSFSSSSGGGSSRRSCMCSPTNHPGSFRCSLHKERKAPVGHGQGKPASPPSPPSPVGGPSGGCRLGAKRMGSALVRIGAVEGGGQWARRALAATARPSQHRRRAGAFRPRPSRLSAVSMAGDRAGDNLGQ